MDNKTYRIVLISGILLVSLMGFVSDINILNNAGYPTGKQSEKSVKKQYLGANYNEFFEQIKGSELKQTDTKWIRGFLDFFELYNERTWLSNRRLRSYLTFDKGNIKTVVNIKFNFKQQKFPVKGSEEWNSYFDFLDKLLKEIIDETDVIVVGNEPFLEAGAEDYDRLNVFYQAACDHVHQYFLKNNINKPIFVGAFLNTYLPKFQVEGVRNLLGFAKETDYIAGIDVHIHHDLDSDITKALDFVNDKIRDDQKIVISEFSLVARWRKHLKDSYR